MKVQNVTSFRKEANRIVFSMSDGELQLYPLSGNTLRVKFVRQPLGIQMPEWIYVNDTTSRPPVDIKEERGHIAVILPSMKAQVDKMTGRVTFLSPEGKTVLRELDRELIPSSIQGVPTYHATQRFYSPTDEHLFGLGQFQDGYLDVRGLSRRLTQVNTQIATPMLVSDKGYGILWNNYGLTDFNPANDTIRLAPVRSEGKAEKVEITSAEGGKEEIRNDYIFASEITKPVSGRYSVMLDIGQTMARKYHLRIGGKTIFDMNNLWLPPTTSAIVELKTGTYDVEARLEKNDRPTVLFKRVTDDYWNDHPVAHQGWVKVPCSMEHIPVYVKAGSILPLADGNPQTMKEAYTADWTIKIFTGANGSYVLYEDEGTNYNYEKGLFSKIQLNWNDQTGELTIGQREGKFPGMIENRRIRLVKVSAASTDAHDIFYKGERMSIRL